MRLSRSDAKQNGRAALICKAYAKRRLALQAASDQCFIGRYKNFRFLTRPKNGILLPGFGTHSRGSNARNIQSVSLADLTKLPPAEAVFTVGRMARKKQICWLTNDNLCAQFITLSLQLYNLRYIWRPYFKGRLNRRILQERENV